MNPQSLRRISIAGAILTVLIAIDGFYMVLSNYHPDDTGNNGFGSFHPSDGVTVLIAAALLLIITIVAFMLSTRTASTVKTEAQAEKPAGEAEAQA